MKRDWNWLHGPQGSGRRFAQALGCISEETYVRSVIALHQGVLSGAKTTITAERAKFDAEGSELEDHKQPGDYLTTGYRFDVGGEVWLVDREPSFEGERAAEDYSDALGQHADRDFCEAMVHVKSALDRFGGQAFFIPGEAADGQVIGVLARYEHLVREPESAEEESGPQPEENGADQSDEPRLESPDDQGEDAADTPDPDTPEGEHARIEAEQAA